MKRTIFALTIFLLLLLTACSSTQYVCPDGSTVDDTSKCGTEETITPPTEIDVKAEAEQFAEKLAYHMNNEQCGEIYDSLKAELKEGVPEFVFVERCNYWVYEMPMMVDKVVEIDEDHFTAYMSVVDKDNFETVEIRHVGDGEFEYEYFDKILKFKDVNEFCKSRPSMETCIRRYAVANNKMHFCAYLINDYEIKSCESGVRKIRS